MACERPVVSTPVGHVTEVIRDGDNGLIAPVGDAVFVADSVLRIISDVPLAEILGHNGRKTILEGWTWAASLEPMAGIYGRTVASGIRRRKSSARYMEDLVKLMARSLRHRFLPGGILTG
jgi:hypothetical protein